MNKKVQYETYIDWRTIPERFVRNFHFEHDVYHLIFLLIVLISNLYFSIFYLSMCIYASYEFERDHVVNLGPWIRENISNLSSIDLQDSVVDTYTVDSGT